MSFRSSISPCKVMQTIRIQRKFPRSRAVSQFHRSSFSLHTRITASTPHSVSLDSSKFLLRPFSSTHPTPPSSSSKDPPSNPEIQIKELSDSDYDHISEIDMEKLYENLEILCEDHAPEGWEVEYSSGVLNLQTPQGTYVLNKQPPNHQIWMSSPISGPARFGYGKDGSWVHHRRVGVVLGGLLEGELRETLGGVGEEWEGVGLR